jgi:maleate cis-trans isomerase
MMVHSWRGTVGVIKPTYRVGSLESFIRLLPDGVGVLPLYLNVRRGTEKEFLDTMDAIREKVAELAEAGVDLIHPEGAPPFMLHGFDGEAQIVAEMQAEHRRPVYTSGMTHVEALRALNVRCLVGVTYFSGEINERYATYFRQAGFEVLAMEGIPVPFEDVVRLSPYEIYAFVKKIFLNCPQADGLYLLGSAWKVLGMVEMLEQDLGVPVVHPVPARVWATQKRLHVRETRTGFGRLLAEMP